MEPVNISNWPRKPDSASRRPGFIQRVRAGLDVSIFCGLLGVMVMAVVPYGTVDPWWEGLFESCVFGLTAICLVEFFISGKFKLRPLFVIVPLIFLTLFSFAQAVRWPTWLPHAHLSELGALTIDRYQTLLTGRKTLALTMFLGMLLHHTRTTRRVRWLVRTVVAVGLASALFAILRQVLQAPDSPSGFVLPFLFYGVGYGHFISPNAFAYLMEMSFGLLAGLVLGGGVRRDHALIYVAITVPIWTALVLSNSRGGLVGMTIQFLFVLFIALGWVSRRPSYHLPGLSRFASFAASRGVRTAAIVLVTIFLIGAILWMGGESLNSKFASQASVVAEEGTDGNTRREIWTASWDLFKGNPWTGVGFGAYFLGVTQHQKSSGRLKLEQAHNDYLDLAANGGLVAVALGAWFVILIIRRGRTLLKSGDAYRRAAVLGATAGILSVAVHSLVDFGLQLTGIGVVFVALIVIAVAEEDSKRPQQKLTSLRPSEAARTDAQRGDENDEKGIPWVRWACLPLIILGVFGCYLLIRLSSTSGISRLMQTSAIIQAKIQPADKAVSITPNDPEAHYTRGLTLVNDQKLEEAVEELRTATRLRPYHYYEWLDLGVTLDRLGNEQEALSALNESVRLAPSFAQPRWQLGNLLYRQGKFEEAFAAMRMAAQTNSTLFTGMLNLAWVGTNEDVDRLIPTVKPITRRNHLELAKFLAVQGKSLQAAQEAQIAGAPRDEISYDLWRQTVNTLILKQQFRDAYTAWATVYGAANSSGPSGALLNGNFVDPIVKDLGFGWQFPAVQGVDISTDSNGPDRDSRSLLLTFNGDFPAEVKPVYQLVLVEPRSSYTLTFSARTEGLVSGGPPVVIVEDANGKALGLGPPRQSKIFPTDTGRWIDSSIDFMTGEDTTAVVISVRRLPCSQTPCPVFGKLWLSHFGLKPAR